MLKNVLVVEARDALNKIVEIEQEINRDALICKAGDKKNSKRYDSQQFKATRFFGREIYNYIITLNDKEDKRFLIALKANNFQKRNRHKGKTRNINS